MAGTSAEGEEAHQHGVSPVIGAQRVEDDQTILVLVGDHAAEAPGGTSDAPPAADAEESTSATTKEKKQKAPRGKVSTTLRVVSIGLAVIALGLVLQLAVVSSIQQSASQGRLFNEFRTDLALGKAPKGPLDINNKPIPLGTPVAQIRIPALGVNQIVVEGTRAADLATGPGHYTATVFPGGAGTSVILGRAAAYGGPFGNLKELKRGERITVTTQVGTSVFRVVDIRPAGAKVRPVRPGKARLTLGTAAGTAFVPSGVLWVDADKVGAPLLAQTPIVTTVPANQRPLGVDTGGLWVLVLWVAALAAVVVAAGWTWRRRGPAQAWIVFFAPAALLWILLTGQIVRILPNLL